MAYKNITKLSKDLHEMLKRLEYGELQSSDLDAMADDARDLYERITILRYRAHDEKSKRKSSEDKLKSEIPVLFKMESKVNIEAEISPNQTSLIDAIDDIVDEKNESPVVAKTKDMFSEIEEIKPESKEKKKPQTKVSEESKAKKVKKVEKTNTESDIDESLVEKLEKAPIKSLQKAINLNLKFRFINELFEGKADQYKSFVSQIDDSKSRTEADKIVESEGKSKHKWDMENEEVILFFELLDRRF